MKKVTKVKMLLIMLCALFISVCSISCSDDDDNVLKVDTVAFISQLTDYQNQLETLMDRSMEIRRECIRKRAGIYLNWY